MAEYEACILGLRLAVDMGVQEVLVLGDLHLLMHQIQGEWETRDLKLIPYRQCLHDLCQRFRSLEFMHIPRIHNEVVNVLATLVSMLHHPDKAYMDPLHIQVCYKHAYCNVVEEELDGEPWFHDIRKYIKLGVYPVHGDLIHSPPSELHTMSAPWPFVSWGMNVIGLIEPTTSNGHRYIILVAIDYFTKWVEAVTFKYVTKKAVVDFVHSNLICRFEIPKVIITVNAANLSSHLMKEVKTRLEQLSMIDEKRLAAVCHGQLYQKRMAKAYNKKVRPRKFKVGQQVLKCILPHQVEAKGKFAPNWQGSFIVTRVLSNSTLYLIDIEGKRVDMAVNFDAVKRYYV
ncbi:uncharacterized protein [Nicotiana sylvestris]|uniref:uncharacterized protein n=1 Tax=Nicotiana sylvestris TaxID=4096 RepID=UPI00388C3CE6